MWRTFLSIAQRFTQSIHKISPTPQDPQSQGRSWERIALGFSQIFKQKFIHAYAWLIKWLIIVGSGCPWGEREAKQIYRSQTKIHSYHLGCSPLRSPHNLANELLPGDLPPRGERSSSLCFQSTGYGYNLFCQCKATHSFWYRSGPPK